MSLSYYYEFAASATTTAEELQRFLEGVQQFAEAAGFDPSVVLNVPFDTEERRDFARRLGMTFTIMDERLKGATVRNGEVYCHDPTAGECQLFPKRGVVLVLTDERGCEACFGFFKFPERVVDIHGREVARTELNGAWTFRDFVDSPDPRYREIVGAFSQAGFVKSLKDEFA